MAEDWTNLGKYMQHTSEEHISDIESAYGKMKNKINKKINTLRAESQVNKIRKVLNNLFFGKGADVLNRAIVQQWNSTLGEKSNIILPKFFDIRDRDTYVEESKEKIAQVKNETTSHKSYMYKKTIEDRIKRLSSYGPFEETSKVQQTIDEMNNILKSLNIGENGKITDLEAIKSLDSLYEAVTDKTSPITDKTIIGSLFEVATSMIAAAMAETGSFALDKLLEELETGIQSIDGFWTGQSQGAQADIQTKIVLKKDWEALKKRENFGEVAKKSFDVAFDDGSNFKVDFGASTGQTTQIKADVKFQLPKQKGTFNASLKNWSGKFQRIGESALATSIIENAGKKTLNLYSIAMQDPQVYSYTSLRNLALISVISKVVVGLSQGSNHADCLIVLRPNKVVVESFFTLMQELMDNRLPIANGDYNEQTYYNKLQAIAQMDKVKHGSGLYLPLANSYLQNIKLRVMFSDIFDAEELN